MPTPTPNLNLERPDFNVATWHDEVNGNFTILDSAIYGLTGIVVQGLWTNATAYTFGDRVVDPDLGSIWTCAISHSSAVTGSFAADRAANPTYWSQLTTFPVARGAWANSTGYVIGDQVYDVSEGISAICITTHVSNASGTIRDDAVNWVFVIDNNELALSFVARFATFFSGEPLDGELLVRYEFADTVEFAANMVPSQASSILPSAGVASFSIRKNGAQFANCTFTTSTDGVFSSTLTTFVSGDILTVIAPSPNDGNLADISITLAGTRLP